MAGDQRLRAIWKSPLFWLAAVIVFAIPLLADFNARLGYIRQMTAEASELSKQIAAETAHRDALLALQEYVRSNEYVEHWARMARMAHGGETVIVPSVIGSTPTLTNTTSSPVLAPNDVRSEWIALFLGSTTTARPSP